MKRNVYTQQVSLNALDTLIDEFRFQYRESPDYLIMNYSTFSNLKYVPKIDNNVFKLQNWNGGIISSYKGIAIAVTEHLEDGIVECVRGD